MKNIISTVIIALVLTRTALSSEYREFTNQDGNSIHARIVQYDATGEKVQLELQNRKKAWVQLSDLSEADQDYIRQYHQEKDNSESVKALSKRELRAIGEQYIQAWRSGDIENVRTLFLQPEKITDGKFSEYKEIICDIHIGKVGAWYIEMDIDRITHKVWWSLLESNMGGEERRLLLTPDGKIKYDSILLKHPIEIALKSMPVLYDHGKKYKWAAVGSDSNILSERTYSSLKRLGIPMFGLDLSAGPDEIDQSLLQITEWLLEEGDKWDSTEPKVFFPNEWLQEFGKLKAIVKQGYHDY